ncbi:class III signal peptide-containing protein [Thermococcus stetteri]|uniref:class III signal peptide-containing protein n=1 Tax=Thermococcus stetteri TaxID=49900 RepID=UPI001AE7CA88|nr:class III signal peptide-containing protein [Thermococcus stetteri]MBP1911992.1 uncharacterized protein (UPF0333 family) [Thermococcus stetteri]
MKRGQAAVEYLMMVAVALLMVAFVARVLHKIAVKTSQTISNATESLNKEVISSISNATS